MRIAIIGAGFTGLTAAYELIKKGHQVIIFEKDGFAGGLASGIRQIVADYPKDWDWDLERFYHHWFTNHHRVIKLADELGLKSKLFTEETTSAILFQGKIFPYDSVLDYLRFPHLPLINKVRGAKVLAFLKLFPFWRFLEKFTAASFLERLMGIKAFETPWKSLLVGKFNDDWLKVNLAWFQSRVKDRTKKLMYIEGGFQTLVDAIVNYINQNGGQIRFNTPVDSLPPVEGRQWSLKTNGSAEIFDKVIVTTSPGILSRILPNNFTPRSLGEVGPNYQHLLSKQKVIGAQVLVLVLDKPLMDKVYWLNINDSRKGSTLSAERVEPYFPFLALVEHTNFIDPKYFGGNHIVYVGEYQSMNHPRMQMSKEELLNLYLPYLEKIAKQFNKQQFNNLTISHSWLFREPFAQPIFPVNHSKDVPALETPFPNLYLASMNQVYPFDRGVEHAIELAQRLTLKW